MKKLELNQMDNLEGGTNRQCLIDGGLTFAAVVIGGFTANVLGASVALIGGLFAANSNGCFES